MTTSRLSLSSLFLLTLLFPAVAPAQGLPVTPPTVGYGQPYAVTPQLDDAQALESGRIWTETLQVPGAFFLKPHFVGLNLAEGDELVVRSASGRVVETLTGTGPKSMGTFWGLSGRGEKMTLELRFRAIYEQPPFRIDEIVVGDFDVFGGGGGDGGPESICSPAQFEDVICYDSDATKWANVQGSVGVMSVGGNPTTAIFCSGSNVSPDNYVLTNDHCLGGTGTCGGGSCAGAEFVFKFYRTGCNNGSPTTEDWESFRCNEIVANSPCISCNQGLSDLDFTLASVLGDPAASYGWVEPDPVPLTDGEAIYIIQHPNGRPHEITHGSGANVDVDGTVLRYYDTLDTEGGSSGSPIFRESDGKLVGLHHCGGCTSPGVGNRGMLMSDIYPHIEEFLGVPDGIFTDGFESGDTSAWSVTVE